MLEKHTWCFICRDGELTRSTVFNTKGEKPEAVRWLDECDKCPAMKVTLIENGSVFYIKDKKYLK